eukprot:TRINITY_DN109698_c0_g1_i1.p1 TRINITY_DN109698_c0_g1~~TRINITY_DN109698_c0_g1_i1.p1  ORF type:complete len:560 (+),score=82.72 TRINITY_DN109698_c0_g1_i1:31-1680(+)
MSPHFGHRKHKLSRQESPGFYSKAKHDSSAEALKRKKNNEDKRKTEVRASKTGGQIFAARGTRSHLSSVLSSLEGTSDRSSGTVFENHHGGVAAFAANKMRKRTDPLAALADVRHAAAHAAGAQGPTLRVFRSRQSCQQRSGRSCLIHPLSKKEFWEEHFGRKAVLLKRGPLHPLPFAAATAAKLLKGFTMGINAFEIEQQVRRKPKNDHYSQKMRVGEKPLKTVAQGKAVRLENVQRFRPRILGHDPFLSALRGLAPGSRGPTMNLYWAPPNVSPQPPHEATHEQFIVQLYGAREWTICPRGLESVPASGLEARSSGCIQAYLRRGDALHIPSRTWHWSTIGPGLSAHLVIGALPLVAADLLIAAGAQRHLTVMRSVPLLGEPLPLWPYHGQYHQAAAAESVVALCKGLPWHDPESDKLNFCRPSVLTTALQRLLVGSGESATGASWARTISAERLAEEPRPLQPPPTQRASSSTATERSRSSTTPLQSVSAQRSERRRRDMLLIALVGILLLMVGVALICAYNYISEVVWPENSLGARRAAALKKNQ